APTITGNGHTNLVRASSKGCCRNRHTRRICANVIAINLPLVAECAAACGCGCECGRSALANSLGGKWSRVGQITNRGSGKLTILVTAGTSKPSALFGHAQLYIPHVIWRPGDVYSRVAYAPIVLTGDVATP